MKNIIIIAEIILAGSLLMSCLTGCSDGTKDENISSWEENLGVEELTELEEVEHQIENQGTYSVANEKNGSSEVYVYVCGQVSRPGVYELPQGSRIYEAIELAGGMTNDALATAVNQALLIEDGMQITVPGKEDAIQLQLEAEEKGLINLNTADIATLTSLKGIGVSRAEAIIAYREEKGLFKSIEDVMNVPGIKQGAFDKIKDSITVY